ncbi:MAG: ATP-dependent helicase [Phycisphaerales bacterium]|nr:MAG: ATP-dependent helicase [Phycisphaerales bacterium]
MAATWLNELNDAQRRAVTHGLGPLLIIAGAGTGKTKTLASRVAYLIDQGTSPDRIMLLTFTRRAAAEMISRARHITGQETAGKVWSGTFHSVANRLLRLYGRSLNLPPDFTIMDEGDAADTMNLIRTELSLGKGKRRFPRKATLVKIYSHTVNAQRQLDEVLDAHFPWCAEDIEGIALIFQQYLQRKTQNHSLDYDDLLLYWKTLTAVPGAGEKVADRFEHILVDEYQDTNSIQAQILRGMRKKHENIVVVGDDAQSIYAFRAATIRNILDFPDQFSPATVVTLEQNYRSTQPILAASNAVMEQARERYTKELWSKRPSEQKPVLVHCQDEKNQTDGVCQLILDHLEEGVDLMQQAVLFRASHHSAELEIELAKRNIPFHKFGGLKFIEAAHIKDMLALLRILENPYDRISWFRVLQLLEGIGPKTARRIMDSVGMNGDEESSTNGNGRGGGRAASPLARLLSSSPTVPAAAREQFTALRAALADCSGLPLDAKASDDDDAKRTRPALTVQIERIGEFYKPIFERVYENAAVRLRDIEQLERIASRYKSRGRFITDLTLDPPTSTSDLAGKPFLEEDYLTLSTIHSAKGCEWTVVHVLHAADGMIPSDMALNDDAGEEEERRLFYVAMTRAKDHLYVHFPLRYYHRRYSLGDRHSYAQLTRFIPDTARTFFEERIAKGDETDDAETDQPTDARELKDWLNRLWQK